MTNREQQRNQMLLHFCHLSLILEQLLVFAWIYLVNLIFWMIHFSPIGDWWRKFSYVTQETLLDIGITVVVQATISMQCFCILKSAIFCLSNGQIEVNYSIISALFLLALHTDQEVSGTNALKFSTYQIPFFFHQSGLQN